MIRYNEIGQQLLDYKTELLKDYPALVYDALITSLTKIKEDDIIDYDAFTTVTNNSITMEEMKAYIVTHKRYMKTAQEMEGEFEELRKKLDEKISEIPELEDVYSENNIKQNAIEIKRKFSIDEACVMNYFGVNSDGAVDLMKKRGFVEKFAALRLAKILKDFSEQLVYQTDLFKIDNSPVFCTPEEYAIEYEFIINIEDIESWDNIDEILQEINRIKQQVDTYYTERFIA